MGFLDIHADTIERNALGAALRPGPAPDPSFSMSAVGASIGKYAIAGGLEGFASILDFSSGVDKRHAEEVKAREKRLGLDPSSPYIIQDGRAARKQADAFMADPLTAHWATQAVGGLSKTLTKAGVSIAIAGPAGGAALFGLAEADDVAQRLQAKGIDSKTAWQVGGVVGAVSAAGVALPISGAAMAATAGGKVAATAALGVAGGPLSYMGQESAAREILQRAGHADEAKLHDPTDPIGLTVSLFPLLIGGAAVRGAIKRMGPVKTEAGVKDAVQLSPAEQAQSDAFERSAGNLAELQKEIGRTKDPVAKAVLLAELDKQTKAAAGEVRGTAADHAAVHPEAVDAARVAVLDETVARSLPDNPMAHAEMLRAADMVGAGERVDVMPMARNDPSAPSALDWTGALADARAAGRRIEWMSPDQYLALSPEMNANPGKLVRLRAAAEAGEPLRELPSLTVEANPDGTGGVIAQEGRHRATLYREAGVIEMPVFLGQTGSKVELRTFRGQDRENTYAPARPVGRFDPNNASLTDPISKQSIKNQYADGNPMVDNPASWVLREKATGTVIIETFDKAKVDALNTSKYEAVPIAKYLGEINGKTNAPSPAQAANLAAATPARGAGDVPGAGAADAGRPAADVQAAGIGDRHASAEQQAAQALAEQHPDMPVRLPGEEKTITLADALKRIKQEQAHAAQEADLYRVAVECALTGGAAMP